MTETSRKFKLQGEVVSAKPGKTVVVKVVNKLRHAKYKKLHTVTRKYHAHDEENKFQTGDIVEIQETKPQAKQKRWTVTRKIK